MTRGSNWETVASLACEMVASLACEMVTSLTNWLLCKCIIVNKKAVCLCACKFAHMYAGFVFKVNDIQTFKKTSYDRG